MQDTNIAWTDSTWNPVHGCTKVSAGCEHCFAERISRQYGHTDQPWTNEHAEDVVSIRPDRLEEPYEWDGRRIFVNSMSDLFHSVVPDEYIEKVAEVMRETPRHVYQVLTKRPGRAAAIGIDWPENVWLGTSVEDHRVTERIDLLRDADAGLLFVSFEPLIGPVGDVDLSGYEWVIVGGESGPDYREMDHEWARDIRKQARDQDVAFFFKQSSGPRPETGQRLTVERDGLYVQKRIQNVPDLPMTTREARP
jgi:protein gp37